MLDRAHEPLPGSSCAWVIGERGLLGSTLVRRLQALGMSIYRLPDPLPWGDGPRFDPLLTAAVAGFARQAEHAQRWQIYWAAGKGTMSSIAADLVAEAQAVRRLLDAIDPHSGLTRTPGAIALASSAGAIYAGSRDEIITEASVESPNTAYAEHKLLMEGAIETFSRGHAAVGSLQARISTLYGAGQAEGKRQGLLSYIARNMLRNRPINIYVSLDTIRDYIDAEDAALSMVEAMPGSDTNTATELVTGRRLVKKIIAAERPTSIAEIVATFKRIARRPPLIITSATAATALYTRRVQFRSIVPASHGEPRRKSLAVGIAQLMAAEMRKYAKEGG